MSEDRSPFPTPTETWKNERTIRVFISSTFRDMEDEREELIKRTFPALREFCSARAVGLNEIDLRWGITDEQVSQGKLLPLLLGEIDTCRPYFIGVLGQRYGSRLNEIAEEEVTDAIVRDHPWLARYCGRSITELEILHAILLRPEWADRGFFFLKDAPHPNDETAENRADLAALKARIEGMKGDLAAVRNYSTAEELGRKVRESLEAAIDTDFPDRELSLLDRERYAHLAFAQHRSKAYRAPADTIRALDRRLEAGGAAVVTGPVGSGKSALLANWASNLPESVLVLTHFVGASSGSTNHVSLLSRILAELKRELALSGALPLRADEIIAEFPTWLGRAGQARPLVLVIDGLNQLDPDGNAHTLGWLPRTMPSGVTLLVSTLSGPCLKACSDRHWPEIFVHPLTEEERGQLVVTYLKEIYGKELAPPLVERIAATEAAGTPLFLRAFLDEIRMFGDHHRLEERVSSCLEARDTEELYGLILERMQDDYEQERPGIVGRCLSLLWAARFGLSEQELLEITDLEPVHWSPIYLALREALLLREGVIDFFHDSLRGAVRRAFVDTPQLERMLRLELTSHFQAVDSPGRRVEELPWQMEKTQRWGALTNYLSSVEYLDVYRRSPSEAAAYWGRIEARSFHRCVLAYQEVLEVPEEHLPLLAPVAELFQIRGHNPQALRLLEAEAELHRGAGSDRLLRGSLLNRAVLLSQTGRLADALPVFREHEALSRTSEDLWQLQKSLGNQGVLFHKTGDTARALRAWDEQQQICEKNGYTSDLFVALNNRALVFSQEGRTEEAEVLALEAQRVCIETGNTLGLGPIASTLARLQGMRGHFDEAIAIYQRSEETLEHAGFIRGAMQLRINRAHTLIELGEMETSRTLATEVVAWSRRCADPDSLSGALICVARSTRFLGDIEAAMLAIDEAIDVLEGTNDLEALPFALETKAEIYLAMGKVQIYLKLLDRVIDIAARLEKTVVQYDALKKKAAVLQQEGRGDEAMLTARRATELANEIIRRTQTRSETC